jgi:hypothetical protein
MKYKMNFGATEEGTFSFSVALSIGRLLLAGAVLPSLAFEDDRKFPALLRKPNLSLIFFRKILKIGFSDFVFLKTAL